MLTLDCRAERRRLWLSFLLPMLTAFFIFLPFLIVGKGFFTYCGDFNSQQIPFYLYSHDFIRSGGGSFSWATDLGSSFMNSYSFYTLGSPFFWLTLLFPSKIVPYLMVPLLMLKFSVAGLGAYLYLRRYTKNRQWALLGCLLYSFSGWGVYDIFFNHFIDCLALFPFLLWSMDDFIYEKRRGPFVLFVAINMLNNYFFFLGEVLFLVLYFFIKVLSKDYRLNWKEFANLVFEAVCGCLLGCLLLFPAAASLLQNPRTTSYSDGYGLLLYGKAQQYFAILVSAFLPPDPPYLPNLFTDCNIKWTSMSLYLPLFSATGVIAYLRSRKKTANRRLLFVCLIMALVPVLNSSFYALNSSYYARWFYMPTLIMALCTVNALEYADVDLSLGIKPVVCVIGAAALFGLVPTKTDGQWHLGGVAEPEQFWVTILLAALGVAVVFFITRSRKTQKRYFSALLGAVMGFSCLYAVIHLSIGKFPQWEGDYNYKAQCYDTIGEVDLPTDHFFRTDSYESYDNLSLFWDVPNIRCFNSTVAPSILEFYPSVGVKRDVSSKPELDRFALRGLLSVEYMLMPADKQTDFVAERNSKGFVFDHESAGYAIYRNENYIPMGFTYDYYMTDEDLATVSKDNAANLMVRALLLSDEQIEKYGSMLTHADEETLLSISYQTYQADCDARKAAACDSFTATRSGFEAEITLSKANLVFFSVPYDEGFSATVNGSPAEVLKVNNGLIAIPADAGSNAIVLRLTPTWLPLSITLTVCGALLYLCYLLFFVRRRRVLPEEKLAPAELFMAETRTEQDLRLARLSPCAGCAGCAHDTASGANDTPEGPAAPAGADPQNPLPDAPCEKGGSGPAAPAADEPAAQAESTPIPAPGPAADVFSSGAQPASGNTKESE